MNIKTMISITLFALANNTGSGQSGKDSQINEAAVPSTENYFNTVTGTRANQSFKFVLVGDMLPRLSINGQTLSRRELEQFAPLVDSLSEVIWQRQEKEAERINQILLASKQAILADIVSQGIAKNKDAVQTYYLNAKQLTVNGIEVSRQQFEFFKKKYPVSADKAFYYEK